MVLNCARSCKIGIGVRRRKAVMVCMAPLLIASSLVHRCAISLRNCAWWSRYGRTTVDMSCQATPVQAPPLLVAIRRINFRALDCSRAALRSHPNPAWISSSNTCSSSLTGMAAAPILMEVEDSLDVRTFVGEEWVIKLKSRLGGQLSTAQLLGWNFYTRKGLENIKSLLEMMALRSKISVYRP